MMLHWTNEHNDMMDCEKCIRHQCKGKFELGFEEWVEVKEADGSIRQKQEGYRFKFQGCLTPQLDDYIEYLNFFWNVQRWGLPRKNWLKMPKQLFEILNILKMESNYLRMK